MPTKSGHSGSPIIAFNRDNKPYIIGIHTHRGLDSSYNSGIYFNN
jgi:V8-like Glu-specific endopeptidase